MMKMKGNLILLGIALVAVLFYSAGVDARGRGGAGGGRSRGRSVSRSSSRSTNRGGSRSFSRSGPASRGSFSSRPPRRTTRPAQTRPSSGRNNRMAVQGQPNKSQGRPSAGQGMAAVQGRPSDNRRPGNKNKYLERNDRAAPGQSKRQENRDKLKDRQDDRQEWLDKNREDIQEAIKDRQEDRQDFIDDQLDEHRYDYHWDYHDDDFVAGVIVGGVVVGTAAAVAAGSTTAVTTLPCTAAAVVVDGVTYYHCDTTWYRRSYAGSQVTYIIVNPPPGH